MATARTKTFRVRRAFTLIELVVAAGLLVMIMLAVSFVFATSSDAISEAEAAGELAMRIGAFEQTFRTDINNIEHQGLMAFGARIRQAYGSELQKERERQSDFRIDWLEFVTNGQQNAALDENTTGQWSRVFYGHATSSDPDGWSFVDHTTSHPLTNGVHTNFTNLANSWNLMRQQIMTLHGLRSGTNYIGCEVSGSVTQYGTGAMYRRTLVSHYMRDFRWHQWDNGQWNGSYQVNYGPDGATGTGRLAIYEPIYYHYWTTFDDSRNYRAMAHCASFQIQYALPHELRSGPGGSILWHDPPMFTNTDLGSIGPTTANPDHGRIMFRPGDVWPVLFRVTVQVFDPLERIPDGRTYTGIYRIP